MKYKSYAFYLPQFHPIPENDMWWGKGFTEWTNVSNARPKFDNHYQPHIPTDLGFYDLRVSETRIAQTELAKKYGIDGFIYYHYWFNGKRLLNRPLDEILSLHKPDFPFCLCWANESWSNKSGPTYNTGLQNKEVLINQKYSTRDDVKHINWLLNIFKDPRYIRINNKPLFIVFRPSLLPNPIKTIGLWRKEARKMGIGDLYLCMVQAFPKDRENPLSWGFDAAIEFQPNDQLREKVDTKTYTKTDYIYSYKKTTQLSLAQKPADYVKFPCVMPSWDNTARRNEGATIYIGSTPKLYYEWIRELIKKGAGVIDNQKIIFVNAWNEWGEGCHLEPDTKWGRKYLIAHKKAMESLKLD